MGRRGPLRLGLALTLFLVAQQSAAEECRTGCRGASHTFKYAQGTTYKYNYEGKIDISLSSAKDQATSTEVKAVVLLTQQADCNQVLRLQNVQVLGSNGKKLGNIPHVDKPIRINFHDGHIEDSICTEPGDTQNSLNIKRAIASLFQVNLKHNHETDVFGLCPTETSHHQEGNVLVVHKNRILNKCGYREHLRQDFFTTTFNQNSEIKSSPVLDGEYSAKLRIKNGILDQAVAIENYLYTPFSVGKEGAKAQVTSKLHLVGTSKDNPQTKCSIPKTILFDNPHDLPAPTSNVNTVLNAVKSLVKTIDVVVGEQTAKEFVNLVKTIRAAKKDDLLAVYNQVKSGAGLGDKVAAKRAFLDALLQAGTGETIEVAITLLKSNELNDLEKYLVYIGLSLVRHVSEASLNAAGVLLDQPNLSYEAYLGIGNLAGRFCQQQSCENNAAVNKLTQKLIHKLGNGKPTNKKSENDMVFALKALGNFGHLSDSVLQKIIGVAQNKQAPNRLRVVALETYLADPCKDKLRNSALHVLQDIQQDSEVRIKAYLVLAQCPTAKIGTAIKALLDKEPSYQVGGFIISHIRNIKASANPDKDLAKQHLGFSVPKKFPIDFRKWSYNGEFSYAIDTLGLAASSEANLIYSQDSFLPRSTSLNLTAEVFGHTFNFLEINTRQENLDKLVEHYFGPKGLLRTSSLGDLLKSNGKVVNELYKHLYDKLDETLRVRRDVSRAEINSIGKAVQIKENALNKDLDLDLSVKAFGSELLFTNLNVYQQGLTPKAIIDNIVDSFAKGLDRLKNYRETLRSNVIFLDVEFDYPTGLGFPLRVAAEGTANVQVQAEAKIDVRALFNNKDTNVHVKLIPSASLEITGRLTLDSSLAEIGLKTVSTLYTATGGDINVNILDRGKNVDVKFGLPVREQKIISGNHEIVFQVREQSGHETLIPLKFDQAKDFSVCLDQLSPFVGLTFCAEMNGPNLAGENKPTLPFPLAGDGKFSVTIENDDLLEYHLKSIVKEYKSVELVVETIGKNRQKLASFQFNGQINPEIFVKAIFESAIAKAHGEARITENEHEKSFLVRLGQNDMEVYGKIGIAISGSGNRAEYKPILEFKAPGKYQQLPVRIDGKVIVERIGYGRKYIFENVKVTLPNNQVVSINGNIGGDGKDHFSDLTISTGPQSASLNGRLHVDPNLIKFNAEVKNSINPLINFNLKGEVKRREDNSQYDSSFQLIHGADLSSKTNIITLVNSMTNRYKNSEDFTIGCKHKLTYPLMGVNIAFEFEETPKSLDYDLDFEYGDIKFGSELEVVVSKKTKGDFDVEFEIYGLGNRVEFKGNRLVNNEESKINNELEINGQKLVVKGTVKHQIRPSNVDVGTDLTVILPTHPTPFKVNSGFKFNPRELDAHNKITSGSTVIIDAFLKANRDGNANGSIKVNIKDVLVVNGQLKANKGTGNANVLIDAQSIKKQVKLESTFQIQPSTTYNIVLTLYPSYNKDKNQKITLSTHNKFSSTNIDSKNSLSLLGKKMEANLKATSSGNLDNGKLNGEVEVILPNDQYFLGKLNRDFKHVHDLVNGQGLVSLEYRRNKNAAGRKVSLKGTYVNTNIKEGVYDVTYNVAADDSNGKNINADISFKRSKEGETSLVQSENRIYGSILKHPLISNLILKCHNKVMGDYEIFSSYGPQAQLKIGGKYDVRGEGKPVSGNIALEMATPSKELKTVKFGASGLVLLPRTSSENLQLEAAANLFVDDDGTVPDAIVDFKGDAQVRATDRDGEIKANVNYGKLGPISAVAGYSQKGEGNKKQVNGNVAVQYGHDKNFKLEGSLHRLNEHEYNINAEVNTPYEGYKKTLLTVDTKTSEDCQHVTSKTTISLDGRAWTVSSELKSSDVAPLIDIKIKTPTGKTSQFYLKSNKLGDKQFGGELKLLCETNNFLLEGNVDANVENIEDFFIKGNVNSPNLQLNKITFELQNKPGKTGKRIQVTIKSAGENLVAGSTSYQARDEHGKYIVDGSGSLKIKDETKSASFKYIRQQLSKAKNGEDGVEISMEATVGDRALDTEWKLTDKQFRALSSYCEKTKECAHFEVDSKVNSNEIEQFNHVLEISVDIRKLGLPHEFGLKAVTERKNYLIDHTVDVHFQGKENKKYQYSVYVHPKEAGASLTTPKRIVSLEAHIQVPKDLSGSGKVSGEVAFYLDKKNQPSKKASLNGWLEFDQKKQSVNGEAKFIHPGLQRPLSASVRSLVIGEPHRGQSEATITYSLDIFAQPSQKLVTVAKCLHDLDRNSFKHEVEVKSTGLGIDVNAFEEGEFDRNKFTGKYVTGLKYAVGNSNYDNVFLIKGGKTNFELLLKTLNVNILKVLSTLNINRDVQVIDTEISSYENNPLLAHLEIKKLNTVHATISCKKNPREKLQFNAGLIPGQIADVRADHVTGSGKTNLFQASIKLDDANFLKPDYSINSKEIEKVLQQNKDKFTTYVNGLQHIGDEWSNDIRKEVNQLGELSKRATPNLQPLRQYYISELQKIKNEILQDKAIKDLGELFDKVFGSIAHSVAEIFVKLSELIEQVAHTLQTTFVSIINTIEQELIPELKEVAKKLTAVVYDLANVALEIVSGYIAAISEIVEKYQPEIKQLAAIFGELGQNVGRFVQKSYEEVRKILTELSRKICEELRALPVFEELQAQYEDFVKNGLPNAEGLIGGIKEIAATIKDVIPSELLVSKEIKDIIDLTVSYLEKKIKNQPVDDIAYLDKFISLNASLFKKILSVLSASSYDFEKPDVTLSLDFLKKLPKLVAIKFSPINYLLAEDTTEEVITFLLSLLNNPRQWFAPFPMFGMILQGRHIFTFDGKYLTFPANCKYLLARDSAEGNFTLVGTYSNGYLSTITLADKHDTITVKSNGQVLFNNVATELPARKPELSAWRDYEMVYLQSDAGIRVECTINLVGCGVWISGFYHSQVKGLLGNGNNEPYDDFTIPNGKIVTSESEFGNSYKIGSCQPVTVPKNDLHEENPICNKLFGWESSMSPCYPFVKTDNFKMACVHGLAADVKLTEMAIASAYVGACLEHNIPIQVPAHLLQCTNGEKTFNVGDKFSVKVPNKAADIVILVDTIKSNEKVYDDLVKPLMQDVIKTLSAKGINDPQIHLIAYGGENQWPSHITVGGKMTFKGKLPDLKFADNPTHQETPLPLNLDRLLWHLQPAKKILRDVQLAIGDTLEGDTYNEAYNYPFRAQAVKSIIVVSSKPCEVGNLKILQKLRALLFKNDQLSLNLITPFDEFNVKDAKKTADVVGFNDHNVFTVSQGKKKPEGNSELYKELEYDDYCVDFTIKNRGNVFVTNNFVNAKSDARKQFIHIAGHNIVEELLNVEEGLDCECQRESPFSARNVCNEVYSKERSTKKAATKA